MADKFHKEVCPAFNHIAVVVVQTNIWNSSHRLMNVRCLILNLYAFIKFMAISNYTGLLDPLIMYVIRNSHDSLLDAHRNSYNQIIAMEILSYPMSLLYALQSLPERRLGQIANPWRIFTTLDVHVVTCSPLFHCKPLKQSFHFNTSVKSNLHRCEDCEHIPSNKCIPYILLLKGIYQSRCCGGLWKF